MNQHFLGTFLCRNIRTHQQDEDRSRLLPLRHLVLDLDGVPVLGAADRLDVGALFDRVALGVVEEDLEQRTSSK